MPGDEVRPVFEAFPGPGDDAARKGPHVLSGGGGAPGRSHGRPARAPDRRPLQIDESWRGDGGRADRADARLACLRACDAHEGRCVIRWQEPGQPTVDSRARGQVTQACLPGTDREALLEAAPLVLDGRALDADVPRGGTKHPRPLRRVGVQPPQGCGVFRTNLPPRLGPRQVADLDRVRWQVERRMRLHPSVHRRDEVDTEPPCARQTLLDASRIASTSAALLAPRPTLKTRPSQAGSPRTEAPLPPRRLAWQLAVSCQSIAEACPLQGVMAQRRGEKMAAWLTPAGKDPNGRRRPAVLEP